MKQQRRLGMGQQFAALLAFEVGVEDEAAIRLAPSASSPFSSTMRTLGKPLSSTLATAMALGSLVSDFSASASHSVNSAKGSSRAMNALSAVAASLLVLMRK